jgi:hypothetical protein
MRCQHGVARSAVQRRADAAGHDPGRVDALAAQQGDDLLAELAQPMPSRASSGGRDTPKRLRCAGSASMPSTRSGEDRWKKLSACDWRIWARFMMRRRFGAVGGIGTAIRASQVLAEAMRWLTGQMPQMRAVSAGISWNGRPSQSFSKPRNWVTWKRAVHTARRRPVDGDLAVALDAGHGVDGDGVGSWLPSEEDRFLRTPEVVLLGRFIAPKPGGPVLAVRACGPPVARQHVPDVVGRRRAAGHVDVDRHVVLMHRPDRLLQQLAARTSTGMCGWGSRRRSRRTPGPAPPPCLNGLRMAGTLP